MPFPEAIPSRDACYRSVATALRAEGGRLFLDASLLTRCYKMNKDARDELLGALESLDARVTVPLWAAQEVWGYTRRSGGAKPLMGVANRLRSKLADF